MFVNGPGAEPAAAAEPIEPVSFSSLVTQTATGETSGIDDKPASSTGEATAAADPAAAAAADSAADPAASAATDAAAAGEAKAVELPAEVLEKLATLDKLQPVVAQLEAAKAQEAMLAALEPDIVKLEERLEKGELSVDQALAEVDRLRAGYAQNSEVAALKAELAQLRAVNAERLAQEELAGAIASSPDKALLDVAGDTAKNTAAALVKAGIKPGDAVVQVAAMLKSVAGSAILEAAKARIAEGAGAVVVPAGSTGAEPVGVGSDGSFASRVKSANY